MCSKPKILLVKPVCLSLGMNLPYSNVSNCLLASLSFWWASRRSVCVFFVYYYYFFFRGGRGGREGLWQGTCALMSQTKICAWTCIVMYETHCMCALTSGNDSRSFLLVATKSFYHEINPVYTVLALFQDSPLTLYKVCMSLILAQARPLLIHVFGTPTLFRRPLLISS